MRTPNSSLLSLIFVLLLSSTSRTTSSKTQHKFLQCLYHSSNSTSISKVIYTPNNSSYTSILQFSIENLRFATPTTPKPLVIVTPLHESHIQATIFCSKKYGMQIRVRSGGHDFEGLSYVAHVPFVIIDVANLRSISINTKDKTAWIQAGATIGELYYKIAKKIKTLGFPAGICPTVGIGGHFSGGGYGMMLRKYGLAADNVIDARMIDVDGRIMDRETMGEDLFWAIRGGGGASFGVILAWKIKLVYVPKTVTVFTLNKTLDQNATSLVHQWQYITDKLHKDIFLRVVVRTIQDQEKKPTMQAIFTCFFLGRADKLLSLMQKGFPELGLAKKDCIEMSWIESTLYVARLPYFLEIPSGETIEFLLRRTPLSKGFSKTKSDYVRKPIPEKVLEGVWERLFQLQGAAAEVLLVPFGGKMGEIPASKIPFPHRAGNIYQMQYLVMWPEESNAASKSHIGWIRKLYRYMAPYVSRAPRAAYFNYRDLDLGTNNKDNTSYEQASIWGLKYFNNNFKRLVQVKSKADPGNFFRSEQSIPISFDPEEIDG
ncbi:tetrahydroberberine oxidase-like [Malania oleifera]|uniref:tetrahydroberberine oxidase-like n=1 Tax=Malania oleifera TaxID=397392 RepID=UPI0025AE92B4|nr:tetrahydroberberine oxidase-like [Malania oleifera]